MKIFIRHAIRYTMKPSPRRRRRFLLTFGCVWLLMAAGCHSGQPRNFSGLVNNLLNKFHPHKKPITLEAARMFDVSHPDVQRAAIAWMARQKFGHEPVYMKAYALAATAPSPLVRGQALLALGTSGQAAVAPTLVRGLADTSSFVRLCAAMALTHVNNPVAIPALLAHLRKDSNSQVRVYCAEALAPYKNRRVLQGLIAALDDRNVAVVQAAWNDLRSQTGRKFPQHARPWRRWLRSQKLRLSAAQ